MPYKNPDVRKERQRERARQLNLVKYRAEGIEPLDLNDPTSPLECSYCGRLSRRHANREHRHWEGCFGLEVAA